MRGDPWERLKTALLTILLAESERVSDRVYKLETAIAPRTGSGPQRSPGLRHP